MIRVTGMYAEDASLTDRDFRVHVDPQNEPLAKWIILTFEVARAGIALDCHAPPARIRQGAREDTVRIRLRCEGDQFIARQVLRRCRVIALILNAQSTRPGGSKDDLRCL